MAKASPLQSSFNGGEFGALTSARVDADRYRTGVETCENYIPTMQGPLIRRSGTRYVANTRGNDKCRLQRFEYSTSQAYMIGFTNLAIRFFLDNGELVEAAKTITAITAAAPGVITSVAHGFSTNDYVYIDAVGGMTALNGRVYQVNVLSVDTFKLVDPINGGFIATNSAGMSAYTSGGTAERIYTVTSPYAEADIPYLQFVQSADVLYIVHPSYAPRKLTRLTATSWALSSILFVDGPYLDYSVSPTTLTTSGGTAIGASVTVTASGVTGINNDTGFQTTDVGRYIRLKISATRYTYLYITARTSTTVVTATVGGTAMAADPTTVTNTLTAGWALGMWSDTSGYPAAVAFHEDRLCFSGATAAPQAICLSKVGDYENMAPTDYVGVISDDTAINYTMNLGDVNGVIWLISGDPGLFAGTASAENLIAASTQGEALTPTNFKAKEISNYGSSRVQPVKIGGVIFFVQKSGRVLRELTYNDSAEKAKAPNRTIIAHHILQSGVVHMAHQKEPQSLLWCVREDGVLAVMTYEKEEDSVVVGWHRQILGGVDANGNAAIVESVGIIPSADETTYDVWVSVKRYINGGYKRFVEYFQAIFDDETEQEDGYFVDGGLTYDNPLTIASINTTTDTITINSHGLSNGDIIRISGVLLYGGESSELNDKDYVVGSVATNTFVITREDGEDVTYTEDDSVPSAPPGFTFGAGGEVREYVTSVGGLIHLVGQEVAVCADGAVQPNATVAIGAQTIGFISSAQGTISISPRATKVHVGYNYRSRGKLLRLEAGSQDGTALGKTRRTHKVGLVLHRTNSLKIGMSFDNLQELTFRTASDPMGRAVPLFSGIKIEQLDSNYDTENQLCWQQDTPLPGTILAIAPQMHTEDAQ